MTSAQAAGDASGEPRVPDIALRARLIARRLLSGAGSAAVTAYRVDPAAPAAYVAHALREDGRVLVAACPSPGTPLARTLDGSGTEVRMDITLDAAEPGVRITAATAHLLGTLTWAGAEEAAGLLATARTPTCHCAVTGEDPLDRVAQVVGAPGGRLGTVDTDRVMLHSVTGVSSHTMPDILRGTPGAEAASASSGGAVCSQPVSLWGPQEVLAAHEAVSAVGQLGLRAVCDAVQDGEVPGWVCSSRPSVGVCASLWDRTLCVDVDTHGVTLMRITGEEVTTLVVPLGETARSAQDVGAALERLAAELLPRRLSCP